MNLVKGGKKWLETDVNVSVTIPNNKVLDCPKLKVFADDKLNLAKLIRFALERVENIVGKGENAGYQHFLLFPKCFQKSYFHGSLKSVIAWY